uniref:Cytochrome c oxidase subunit 6A1, mitochondrial n=1 Tax=Alveopora japonica TaxID=979799 RepID=A0A977XR44_9CNID|nr:cytochrome c oxidase subunit 6A1, mitochondrial [Alveopora japonica]
MALRGFSLLRRSPWIWSPNRRLLSEFAEKRIAEEKHAESTLVFWKGLSLLVAIPGCLYLTWREFFKGDHHDEDDSEYVPYTHLRLRTKPFPWGNGDTSLLHNPHTNKGQPEVDEAEGEEPVKERWKWYEKLWLDYWIEDPDEKDRTRFKHLRYMERRRKEYLAKQAEGTDNSYPIQPMNLFMSMKQRGHEERKYTGIDN